MTLISKLNLKLGCAKCYDSSANEKNHKSFVKHAAGRTQKIQSRFSSQLAKCDYNRVVIDRSYQFIKKFSSKDHSPVNGRNSQGNVSSQHYDDESDASDDDSLSEDGPSKPVGDFNITNIGGQCDIAIKIDANQRARIKYKWKSPLRRLLCVAPCLHLHATIVSYAIQHHNKNNIPIPNTIHVSAYTHATISGIKYRANPYWKGGEWYDWSVVRFPETNASRGGKTCLCRIMGFFRYSDIGMLTYKHLEMEGRTVHELEHDRDDTLYAVLHCQSSYFKHAALEKTFFRKFTMTDHSEMYILPANCLRGPMLVVPDIEEPEVVSQTNFMTMLSRHHMGAHFRHHIHWFTEDQTNVIEEDYRDDW